MPGRYFYLVSALPSLGELGSAAPLGLAELLEHIGEQVGPRQLVEVLVLSDDLIQRESVLAGELKEPSPSVLTAGQLSGEQPLPDYLAVAEDQPGRIGTDSVWAAYFRHAADTARRRHSGFLGAWVSCEVALRNAVAAARAKALELEPRDYLVATELDRGEEDFDQVVSEWAAAPDPLAGLKILDQARWSWLKAHDGWFTFSDDELTAYAAKLMLLQRWQRLSQAREAEPANQASR